MALKKINLAFLFFVISVVWAGRFHRHNPVIAAASQPIPQSGGYRYPVPSASNNVQSQSSKSPPSQTHTLPADDIHSDPEPIPSSSTSLKQKQPVPQISATLQTSAATPNITKSSPEEEHHHHSPVIEAIDVACGKERMTVRVTFDSIFNGIIYAKGHYNEQGCKFVASNSGERMYQFDLMTGQCGVAFIDAGLTDGGQAYVEGLIVVINEPGVQEAWDAARKIRCLWEGSLEQTVTFPLGVNMLDSKLLTFSGDTATVALEIQSGVGPRAPVVQGLVGIGDRLTAVVTVQGDSDFDLLVRNCVATDGTPNNRIHLSDSRGCAVKTKLMGGWTKEKTGGTILAFSEISAFKFPDVMDLFLECTVTLCKGPCEECPNYLTLHVPNHDIDSSTDGVILASVEATTFVSAKTRPKRHTGGFGSNQTLPEESLKLRRVVHVVGPDDLPEFSISGPTVYGGAASNGTCNHDCFSLLGIVAAVAVTLLLVLTWLAIYGTCRRRNLNKY